MIQPAAESYRAALDHIRLRVVEAIAVQVGGIQKIEHFFLAPRWAYRKTRSMER